MTAVRPGVIGAFVLGAFAIIIGMIVFFGSQNLFTPKVPAVIFFQGSVGGLAEGAPVTFRGVRVGSVQRVALVLNPQDMQARIPVYIIIEPNRVSLTGGAAQLRNRPSLEAVVRAGLRAELVTQSFVTGQMRVELTMAPATPPRFVAHNDTGLPEIPAIPSGLEQLQEQITRAPIGQAISQANQTLAAIARLADTLDARLPGLTDKAEHSLDSASRTMDIASTAIQHLERQVSVTLADLQSLTGDGRRQLDARSGDLSRTLLLSNQAIRSANVLLTSANSLLARDSGTRDDLEATIRDLAASASSLRNFSRTIERNPSALLLSGMGR
jgi:paraquat-inducible protein B